VNWVRAGAGTADQQPFEHGHFRNYADDETRPGERCREIEERLPGMEASQDVDSRNECLQLNQGEGEDESDVQEGDGCLADPAARN